MREEYTTVWDTIRVSKRVAMKVCDGDEDPDKDKNVSMLSMDTAAEHIANTGPPPPTCSMNMSICISNGQDISSAEIGDELMLILDVQQNATHGGFARSCVAYTMDDSGELDHLVTDENGCATDPFIFGEWQFERQKGVLTSVFNAFKFPSSNNIRFKCNIQVCSGNCQSQNCSGSNAYGRKKREANAEEDICVSVSPLLSVTEPTERKNRRNRNKKEQNI